MAKKIYQVEIQIYYSQYGNPTVTVMRRNNETREYLDQREYRPNEESLIRLQKTATQWAKKGRANISMNGRLTCIEPTD